jgi:hypothetical protein
VSLISRLLNRERAARASSAAYERQIIIWQENDADCLAQVAALTAGGRIGPKTEIMFVCWKTPEPEETPATLAAATTAGT